MNYMVRISLHGNDTFMVEDSGVRTTFTARNLSELSKTIIISQKCQWLNFIAPGVPYDVSIIPVNSEISSPKLVSLKNSVRMFILTYYIVFISIILIMWRL